MIDIEMLRIIWWLLIGVLLIGFAITDGFDFGVAFLHPLVAKTELERRIVLNSIGPFWEGNQVWIILGAGAIFAAWPMVYAVSFSSFYLLVLLLLLTMGIARPVAIKYRSKLASLAWRGFWDKILFISGLFPALIFGILMGNVLQGVPFYFDKELRSFYDGSFFQLFNPFTIWCGLTSLFMLAMHGGLYLAIKTYDPIRARAIYYVRIFALLFLIFFAIGGVWIAYGVCGFQVVKGVNHFAYSNPLHKEVSRAVGAWLNNYKYYPICLLAPAVGFLGAIFALVTASWGKGKFAFVASALCQVGVIATVGFSMFPFILPSSIHANSSLLVWDSSSSKLTLFVMLLAVIFFMPIILFYTTWVYRALSGKVQSDVIEKDEKHIAY